jgi:S1-C subfamily serine protease
MKPLRIAFAVAVLAALTATPRLTAEEFNPADLYDKCVKSTVFIVNPGSGKGASMGSGSLIDATQRLVLTNYHVVDEVKMVFCQFPVRNKDGSLMTDKAKYFNRIPAGLAIKGKVLHIDKTRDLAIVQLEKLPPDTPALPLAKKSVRVGEKVMNIGNAGKVETTFNTADGSVRGVGVVDIVVGGGDEALRIKARMVSVSIPINPGDSGGPIIDKRGYQVAVTESGYSGAAAQAVNSCVDITEVWGFLSEKKITIKDLSAEKGPPDATTPDKGVKPLPKSDNPLVPKGDNPPKTDTPETGKTGPGLAPPPSADEEKAADMLLRRAQLFAEGEDNREIYKKKLQEVITKHPGTAAAKDAKKKLDSLK